MAACLLPLSGTAEGRIGCAASRALGARERSFRSRLSRELLSLPSPPLRRNQGQLENFSYQNISPGVLFTRRILVADVLTSLLRIVCVVAPDVCTMWWTENPG